MSYRDLVLQFTQAQRLGIDLLAMETYHSTMAARMIQRAQIYPLRAELIGCHTNNPTTAENMYYTGIPVVYMRPSNILTPSQIRVWSVVQDFSAVRPDIVTDDWPHHPCKVLHQGASSTRRFQMSRPHGRYFEDLVTLEDLPEPVSSMAPFVTTAEVVPAPSPQSPDPEDQSFPYVGADDFGNPHHEESNEPQPALSRTPPGSHASAQPHAQGSAHRVNQRGKRAPPPQQPVQSNSRKGRKIAAAHAAGKLWARSAPSVQGQPLARNRNKFIPVESPLMPPTCSEWVGALRAVDRFSPTHNIPKSRTGLMYPDPGYLASVTPLNRSYALPAWLSIRAHRCGQMLHPWGAAMCVLPTTVWHYFFFIYRVEPGGPGTLSTSVPSLTEQPDTAIAAAMAMFGDQAVDTMYHMICEVFWRGQSYTVELAELNWRYELLALDKIVAPHMWGDSDAAEERIAAILLMFSPSSSFVLTHAPFPTEDASIVATTRGGRFPALAALRRLMLEWPRCPSAGEEVTYPDGYIDPDDIRARVLEVKTMCFYTQTFFDYFHRAPVLPCRLP
ncbi:hypothetical protein FIBSPDRAFT_969064 [Athelia psychrophila]|uniref:Uncharacterized protein n=1 Tax=Athelia psychrophila TaxID=1759441 RepID=A0A167TWN0_9AGAM|nr:hypothetical protein FIBSPDRAFT_969064 [Fibularhizoctonia sp. CBS 109695]